MIEDRLSPAAARISPQSYPSFEEQPPGWRALHPVPARRPVLARGVRILARSRREADTDRNTQPDFEAPPFDSESEEMAKPVKARREDRDYEDLVRLYLEDVGRHNLLTKDDEIRLAQAIETGTAATRTARDREEAHARPSGAVSSARSARARKRTASSSTRTCGSSSRSRRSTRAPVSRCSTSCRRATSA